MCKSVTLKNSNMVIARKNGRSLDYYIKGADKREYYLFTKDFAIRCYQKCKSGIPINNLLHDKNKDTAYMKMIKKLKFMLPYFMEYYDLEVA